MSELQFMMPPKTEIPPQIPREEFSNLEFNDNSVESTKENEYPIENIYTKAYKIIENACKSYNPNDEFHAALFGSTYYINQLQRDRIPENTGHIDSSLESLVFICLNELRSKYPTAIETFQKELFYDTDTYLKEDVLNIFKKYPREQRDIIFGKYSEYVDAATSTLQYMQNEFGKGQSIEEYYVDIYSQHGNDLEINIDDENLIHYNISNYFIENGNAFLKEFSQKATVDLGMLTNIINESAIEIEVFKMFFKQLKGHDTDILDKIKSIKFKILHGPELSGQKEIVAKMEEIYLENYADFPQEFQQKILASLEQRLNNPDATFYTLYHQGEIIAFCSFLPREDGTIHFANFNVDPDYSSSKLGEAMMEASLDQEAKKAPIVAEAVPDSPIANTYLTKKGFQKIGEIEVAGVKLLQLRKEKSI